MLITISPESRSPSPESPGKCRKLRRLVWAAILGSFLRTFWCPGKRGKGSFVLSGLRRERLSRCFGESAQRDRSKKDLFSGGTRCEAPPGLGIDRSEEHTSEL